MKKMILPLLAVLIAVGGAFGTKSMKFRTIRWGLKSSVCTEGTLIGNNCGTTMTNKGRCQVEFSDATKADAFDVAGCVNNPLYKQN